MKYTKEDIETTVYYIRNRQSIDPITKSEVPKMLTQLLTENATLRQQLEVAVKALEYVLRAGIVIRSGFGRRVNEALAEIKRIGSGE